MLQSLNPQFRILARDRAADESALRDLRTKFEGIPIEYSELVREATELELQHLNGAYIRIWGPEGCLDMDEGYDISLRIPGAVPIGDNGGGKVLLYMKGKGGNGLYIVGYGDLDAEDAKWVASSIRELLVDGLGAEMLF